MPATSLGCALVLECPKKIQEKEIVYLGDLEKTLSLVSWGLFVIFSLKRSTLLRKRMRADFASQCEFAIDSQSIRASFIWVW